MTKKRSLWFYMIFMIWISYLLSSALFLFVNGFFLNRVVRTERSECILCTSAEHCDARQIFKNSQTSSSIVCPRPSSRVVLLVVDALKYEFLDWRENPPSNTTYHLNKIPIVRKLLGSHPRNTRLFKFIADPPTTTMQRLKGLTTGTLPTFIDVGSNFASESIEEDNLIDQTIKRGGVIFMGDDTWISLFPRKFLRQFPSPSFNVWDLDTVDHQVREKIAQELKKEDWSLLIAHTLGVDHCGHKYGQSHPEMARKLNDTNTLIGEIIDNLKGDMILFVVGDHGMTESGDHGGDSKHEIEAGMFVFSKLTPLWSEAKKASMKIVNQIDLVPTISSILGIPVPFSNIGTLILECLPVRDSREGSKEDTWFAAHSVWRNVVQTKKYIDAYAGDSFLFTKEKLEELDELFNIIKDEAKKVYDDESFERFSLTARSYLKSIRHLCAEIWVQFDACLMYKGVVLNFCILFIFYLIIHTIDESRMAVIIDSNFLYFVVVANIATSFTIYAMYLLRFIKDFKNTNLVFTSAVSILSLVIIVVQNWNSVLSWWQHNGPGQKRINCLEVVLLFTICCLFSNSYVIEEQRVLSFLLVTTIALLCHSVINDDNVVSVNHESTMKIVKRLVNSRKLQCLLMLVGFIACAAVRTSSYFWRCREEQTKETCTNLAGKVGFSNAEGTERNFVAGSLILVYFATVIIWLRYGENFSLFWPRMNITRYCLSVVVVCIDCYWLLQSYGIWWINALPGIVYLFVILGILVLYWRPLGLHVLTRKELAERIFDTDNRLIFSKRKNEERDIPVVVCGFSTAYSAGLISLSVFFTLLWALLLGSVLAPGTFMMFVTCAAVLGIVAMERFHNANNVAELLQVPNSAILCWFLIAEYFFYGTGHQPTFPAIQWDAAFIGTSGTSYGNFLPAILIGVNTFGCHMVVAMILPLLATIPFTVYAIIPRIAKVKFYLDDDMTKGEFILFKHHSTFHNALFLLYGKYILLHGIRTFGCMLTATIHRRHLMVWKIFAPKLIFQGLSLLVSLGSVLASLSLVLRIDREVDDLKSRFVTKIT